MITMIITIIILISGAASAEGCASSKAADNLQPLTDTAAGGGDHDYDHDIYGEDDCHHHHHQFHDDHL